MCESCRAICSMLLNACGNVNELHGGCCAAMLRRLPCSPCTGSKVGDIFIQDEGNMPIFLQHCCTLRCCFACTQTLLVRCSVSAVKTAQRAFQSWNPCPVLYDPWVSQQLCINTTCCKAMLEHCLITHQTMRARCSIVHERPVTKHNTQENSCHIQGCAAGQCRQP